MTNEEATQLLRESKKYWARIHPIYKAHDVAIEVLEKQIPKKPLKQVKTIYSSKATEVLCPACNKSVCTWITLDSHSKKVPYCRYCGQAIDWSDEK